MPKVRIPLVGSKKCTKCGAVKELTYFANRAASKDGLQSVCKSCKAIYRVANRDHILKMAAIYRSEHKEEIAKGIKEWSARNKDRVNAKWRRYADKNKERRRALRLKRYEENKLEIRQKAREYIKKNIEKWRAVSRYHSSMRKALIRGQKIAVAHKEETRLIYKNKPSGHDVDHIVPLKGNGVCGLHVPWNLQYLPTIENRKKGNRYAEG